jgi:hypothetical protein
MKKFILFFNELILEKIKIKLGDEYYCYFLGIFANFLMFVAM